MAKGRMGEKAAKRRAELDAANDLATYQRKVAQLTAENRELRDRLVAQQQAAKQVERRLRAERDEGVAPQVQAVTLQLRSALEQRDTAQREVRRVLEQRKKMYGQFVRHFIDGDGLSESEAYDAVLRMQCVIEGVEWPEGVPFPGSDAEDRTLEVSPALLAMRRRLNPQLLQEHGK